MIDFYIKLWGIFYKVFRYLNFDKQTRVCFHKTNKNQPNHNICEIFSAVAQKKPKVTNVIKIMFKIIYN